MQRSIKEPVRAGRRYFWESAQGVKAALQRVPEQWDSAEDILKPPEVTALYYVLGAMFCLPFSIPSREPVFAHTEYDIFNPPWEKNKED